MSLLDRRRARSERELRRLLRESGGPMPPDEEIREVADFFARSGASALPQLRRAMEELVRAHRERDHGENHSRPPAVSEDSLEPEGEV
jgi:hypothetical protein